MTRLTVVPDAEAAAALVADRAATALADARAARGRAHAALAGGATPRRTYELLATRLADWDGIELWLGDERAVGPQDPESNYRTVAETLLARARAPGPTVHRIAGERGADAAAAAYADELRAVLGEAALDLALLGLGEDGHTASLFPSHPLLDERYARAAAVHDAPKPPPDRVTLTVPVLAGARSIVFLAVGAGKRAAVAGALRDPVPAVPASLLGGARTELIVDRAATP